MPPDTLAVAPIRAKPLPRFRRAPIEERPAFRLTDRDREGSPRQNILYTSAEINRPYSARYSSTLCARVQTAIIARLEKVIEPDA
jgi:hypothetical protein